jgi:predicted  nucleic acid-binding Zn-ribbon protein
LEKELAEAGKASEALSAAMSKLQEELVKLKAERDAGKEAVKTLEAKLKEAAGK